MTFPTFPEFFADVHGVDPYPWQATLAERLAADGVWPDQVDIPTGLGKTACIDVAVWDLARQLHETKSDPGRRRTAPLRIVHVVDRRSIIDQTGGHLDMLSKALGASAPSGPAAQLVRDALAGTGALVPGEPAITFDTLHGHSPDGVAWLRGHRPAVVSTTPHQFVSRLLFRGFGVSPGMSPIHAALTGLDRLVLFDEPHLSEPAIQTILAQQQHQGSVQHALGGVPPGRLVLLGASLPPHRRGEGTSHTITAADRDHERTGKILRAPRDVMLHRSKDTDKDVRAALVRAARDATGECVLVFCNTVTMAQDVQADLEKLEKGSAFLVTARFRPYDRTQLNMALQSWEHGGEGTPRFVVATQTLEAGVDLSAGAVVTEACPWPALQQRVGRVNRRGEHEASVVHVVTGIRAGTKAVYDEDAVIETLRLLDRVTSLSLDAQGGLDTIAAWGPQVTAPTLHAGLLPVLAHTRPRPVADIDPVPFIVGRREDKPAADVRVAWRTDVHAEALQACPPRPDEVLEVPIGAARTLMRAAHGGQAKAVDFGDAALTPDDAQGSPFRFDDTLDEPRVQQGEEWSTINDPRQLRPGSLVVFPTTYGGYTPTSGWEATSRTVVPDLAAAKLLDGGSFWLTHETLPTLDRARSDMDLTPVTEAMDHLDAQLADDEFTEPDTTGLLEAIAVVLGLKTPEIVSVSLAGEAYLIQVLKAGDATRGRTRPMLLADHARDVAHRAAAIGAQVGLSDDLRAAVEHAGYHHDDGKRWDPFQKLLRSAGGTEHLEGLLAKSGADDLPLATRKLAALRAGLPQRWRHEALSARLALEDQGASDLVVHLITAHHGWARPLLLPTLHREQPGVDANQLDDTADRFERLNAEYGPWGLAFLESVVRLADHAASAAPNLTAGEPTTTMPVRADGRVSPQRKDTPLTGLPFDSPLAWWAAFGTLVAANALDLAATLRWEERSGQRVPVVRAAVGLDEIAAQLAGTPALVAQATEALPQLLAKNQKVPIDQAEAALRNLDLRLPGHRLIAAIVSDVDVTDSAVKLCVPFEAANSNAFKTALQALQKWKPGDAGHAMRAVLTDRNDPAQYTDGTVHGLADNQANRAKLDGLGDASRAVVRAIALVPVLHGLQVLSSNGTAPLGLDRRVMHLPVSSREVTLAHLVALLRTVPRSADRPWNLAGVTELAQYERRPVDTYFSTYAHTTGISYA